MNKNCYKLIFSKTKGCLVPVAECIKSAVDNGSSDSVSKKAEEQTPINNYPLSNVFLSVKTFLNPVSSAICLNWKTVSILIVSMVSTPNFAQSADLENKPALTDITNGNINIELDNESNGKVQLHQTENKVIIVDIATPNKNGISDNRFQKFNIENGAVFKNNKDQQRSELVGYLEENKNLTGEEAKVILNQVTGKDLSKIEGALEVLGKQADLVIANPNGINLNGVKTINSSRFVATTSDKIDPDKMQLNVTKGTVTIDVNGFATDNLPYLDIVAKKIEQKGSIGNKDNVKNNYQTNITFVAGSSEYDLNKHEVTKKNGVASNDEVAITGASTGAMYGKNIKLIVTDTGAGVKHDGIILSENDIKLESKEGDIDLGNKVRAKKKIDLGNAKRVTVSNEIKAEESITLKAVDAKLKNEGKLASKKVEVKTDNSLVLDDKTKIVATDLDLKSKTLTNQGRIYGGNVKIDTNKFVNKKEIYADKDLEIKTKGKKVTVSVGDKQSAVVKEEIVADLDVGFDNQGAIASNSKAKLIFKDDTSFVSKGNKFIQAKDDLSIEAKHVIISENDELQSAGKVTIDAKGSVVNNGILASGQTLTINAKAGNIYNKEGILGAREKLILSAKGNNADDKVSVGNIINEADSLLHSEGEIELEANNTVYNLGNIFAKSDLTVKAHKLVNDVQLSGSVEKSTKSSKPIRYRRSDIANHGWHNNFYNLDINPIEFGKSTTKVEKAGLIRAEGNFKFISNKKDNQEAQIINHGVVNVKGTFSSDTDKIVNSMKPFEVNILTEFFKAKQDITFYYQPKARVFLTGLSGQASKKFDSLEAFFDGLFGSREILKSSTYHADNSQAMLLLKDIQSPTFQKAMTLVFGADWRNNSHEQLSKRWNEFKEKQDANFTYLPEEKAKFLANKIEGTVKTLENGQVGSFSETEQITVGKHKFDLNKVEFKPGVAQTENLNDNNIDLSALSDLLSIPNLFIDNSIQLDKTFEPEELDDEDESLLKTQNDEPDLLNPNELSTNGKLLDKLLKEIGEDIHVTPEPEEGEEEYRHTEFQTSERFDSLPDDVQKRLTEKFNQLRQQAQEERVKQAEKAKAQKEQEQQERHQGYKIEEKRQQDSQVEKEKELAKIAEEKKNQDLEEQKLNLQIEKEKQQQALEKEKQKQKEVANEKERAEEKRRIEEYKKSLAEDQKVAAELSKNRFLKDVDDSRPKVDTDPLYRTKLSYINQNDYYGSKYFLNKIGSEKPSNEKVAVIGDNYLEHQLITKSIEKKVDNHLSLKYKLNDAQLVKKLIDNSYYESQELGLKVGEALTKEQQAQLKQDIVWYVKANVNNKEVLLPQVYFSDKTLRDAEKFKGLGDAVLRANEIELKTQNTLNGGTISGANIDIEAKNKIKNKGDVLSEGKLRLVGRKGIDNISRSYVNDNGDVNVQRARIKTDGHLHLETELDSDINSQGSDIKGKTGFVKSRNFNTTDSHETEYSSKKGRIFSKKGENIGYYTETSQKARSVGSNTEFDHLHLAIKNDVNQVGSKIKSRVVTGVVQGNYNTKAGKNAQYVERHERLEQQYSSGHISGGGYTIAHEYDSKDGDRTTVGGLTSNTGAGFGFGLSIEDSKEKENLLTHTNSDLQVEHGILHVLKKAELGGVDINKHKFSNSQGAETQSEQSKQANATKQASSDEMTKSTVKEGPKFKTLSKSEVEDLMTEKSSDFFNKYEKSPEKSGFELSAKEIKSTKQKDEYHLDSERSVFKFGFETEGHSAIADATSHLAKQFVDSQRGVKQDGTVALQHVSDIANIVTGELVGGSSKFGFERNYETRKLTETEDIRTKIAGNITLSAYGGDLQLKNVESDANSTLTLKAKRNVDVIDGDKTKESIERQSRQKLAVGLNSGCSIMGAGCSLGISGSVEGNEGFTTEKSITHNNSLLRAKNLKIAAGKDLNLISSNIKANHLDLHIKGKTNIVSKQDSFDKLHQGVDFSASAGVALSSSTIIKGTGSLGAGYTHEVENSKLINQQAGITADKITGEIKDLNLTAGHFINKDKNSGFRVLGNVSSEKLDDNHHKDGGSVGVSVGINERGASSFNTRGGRSEQKHYTATQQSAISGVDLKNSKIIGEIVDDLTKTKRVNRNDVYASTQFNFEVADLVELGQKAKTKLQSKQPKTDNDSELLTHRVVSSEQTVEMVDNPLYDSIQGKNRSNDNETYSTVGDVNSDIARKSKALAEHIYEEVGAGPYSTLSEVNTRTKVSQGDNETYSTIGDVNSDIARKSKALAEHIYEEVGAGPYSTLSEVNTRTKVSQGDNETYSTVGDANSDIARKSKALAEHIYEEVGAGPYSTLSDNLYSKISQNRTALDEGMVDNPLYNTVRRGTNDPLPELPTVKKLLNKVEEVSNEIYSEITSKTRNPADALPELPFEMRSRLDEGADLADHIYEEINSIASKARRALPTIPEDASKTPVSDDGDYAEIGNQPLAPRVSSLDSEGDYETIPTVVKSTEEKPSLRSKRSKRAILGDAEESSEPKVQSNLAEQTDTIKAVVDTVEPIYAQLDKTPEGRAKAKLRGDEASQGLIAKVKNDEEEVPPALPARSSDLTVQVETQESTESLNTVRKTLAESNRNNNGNQKQKAEEAGSATPNTVETRKSENKSWFAKVKDFFFAKSNQSQAKKMNSDEDSISKFNYDGLEDDINLKNLLALENTRSSSFEENVLKNPEFLAEAREIAKKYIPESTIKQMGNSPEFDEILTEGAKKVEKRINDALTFKPSIDEFNEIQGLVKNLQKGNVVEELSEKTTAITEALADTSKTIQRNPKLKEEIQGAVEEFLKNSQGKDLTVEMIEKLNYGLRPDEGNDRLLYKKENLTKENAVFSSPQAAKIQLNETVDFINQARKQNVEPSVLAGLVYQRLIAYHPFAEGNGRMARVIVNKILLEAGYPPFTKFSSEFETQIIPQTKATAKSATSSEVVKEFLTELSKKSLPQEDGNNQAQRTVTVNTAEPENTTDIKDTQSVDTLVAKQSPQSEVSGTELNLKSDTVKSEVADLSAVATELQNAAGGNKKVKEAPKAKGEQEEKVGLLQRVKQFFIGANAKPLKKDDSVDTPNYEGLEDKLNLKELISLESDRNAKFEDNVLKNDKFLDEAREISKKSIPESTVKQMSHLPEFDDILTEGAKKVESRINKAITFQPSTDEFLEIQQLVKKLPRTQVVEDISTKTTEITEALAATSKTIQRTPELKEQLKVAIEEFLQSSQGKPLSVEMIEKLNYGLRPDEGEARLLYKKENLTKENAVFSSPQAAKIQLAETVDFINQAKAQGVEPSVLSALVYQRLIAYHPFAEGNGRMARVIVNKILLDAGYPAFTKFSDEFEPQIIPQTKASTKSATSSEVVQEFLKELVKKGGIAESMEVSPQNSTEIDRTSATLGESRIESPTGFGDGNIKLARQDVVATEAVVAKPISELVANKDLVEQPRTVLQRIQDQFQPLKVKSKINAVRSSVEEFGGEVSFKFAQSKGEIYKEIVKHVETQNGVCESTCAHWIAKNVNPTDENFFNTLYEGGKKGHLKKETIDSIKKLQTEFINSGSATQQFKLTDNWLQEQGVVPKERSVADFTRRDEVSGTVSKNDVSSLVKAILDTGNETNGVKKISINLEGGSHTVSAAIDGSKVIFFDPNFGEMTFPTHQQFENWLKNAFWQKSGYAGKQEGKRFFNVVNYKKNVK